MPLAVDLNSVTHLLGDLIIMEVPTVIVRGQRRHCYDLHTMEVSEKEAMAVAQGKDSGDATIKALLKAVDNIPATHIYSIVLVMESRHGEKVGHLTFRGLSMRKESQEETATFTKQQAEPREAPKPRPEPPANAKVFQSMKKANRDKKAALEALEKPAYSGEIERPELPKRPGEK